MKKYIFFVLLLDNRKNGDGFVGKKGANRQGIVNCRLRNDNPAVLRFSRSFNLPGTAVQWERDSA
jgi:hypothetical protein